MITMWKVELIPEQVLLVDMIPDPGLTVSLQAEERMLSKQKSSTVKHLYHDKAAVDQGPVVGPRVRCDMIITCHDIMGLLPFYFSHFEKLKCFCPCPSIHVQIRDRTLPSLLSSTKLCHKRDKTLITPLTWRCMFRYLS